MKKVLLNIPLNYKKITLKTMKDKMKRYYKKLRKNYNNANNHCMKQNRKYKN